MSVRLIRGDCRDVLKTLPDGSVHCITTSPPYWGLRDYGTAKWDGGDPQCDHKGPPVRVQAGFNERYFGKRFASDKQGDEREPMGQVCPCGARRIDSQIGLEPSPEAYVATMVEVFREVRRVLRDDGTLWLNMGDSYAAQGGRANAQAMNDMKDTHREQIGARRPPNGLKPKDLVGIPWRVAFALQADGWWLRQDIIWAKPNPMPESVTDRCTKAHEYIFLLSKSGAYYYDADAIAEPSVTLDPDHPSWRPSANEIHANGRRVYNAKRDGSDGTNQAFCSLPLKRNKRSVWEVATAPFLEAHFATFPPALIEPCILAGCPKGGTVLDPFGGAGTTGLVADRLGRNAVLIELNSEYAAMAERRITDDAPLFAQVAAE